ncbi:MAG: hypothetical protein ABI456_07885 [Ktedonobacteraceae bacterium]
MNEIPGLEFPEALKQLYTRLNPQDVEQFYAGYQLWHTRQQMAAIQVQVAELQQRIAENIALMQQTHPSPIALATLVRLQVSGVNDVFLLERMLERGETWLDNTMQQLDYCERFDFINGDYTQWCENALEGAYDWIDSMRDAITNTPSSPEESGITAGADATEELFLQKLSHEVEAEEDQSSDLEITLKIPRISLPSRPMPELSDTSEPSDMPVTIPEPVDTVEASNTPVSAAAEPVDAPVVGEVEPVDILEPTGIAEISEPESVETAEPIEPVEAPVSAAKPVEETRPVKAPEPVPVEVTADAIDFSIPESVLEEDVVLVATPAEAPPVVEQDGTVVEAEPPATQAEVAPLTQEEPAQPAAQVAIEPDAEEITLPATQLAAAPVEEPASEQETTPAEADLPDTQAEVSAPAEESATEQETTPAEADLLDTQAEVAEPIEEPAIEQETVPVEDALPDTQAEVSAPAEESASIDTATEADSLADGEPSSDIDEDTLMVPAILMPTAEPAPTTDAAEVAMPSLEAPPVEVQEEAMEPDAPATEIPNLSTTTSAEPQEETAAGESLPEADATTTEAVTAPGEPGAVTFVHVAGNAPTAKPPLQEYIEPEQTATTEVLEQAPAGRPEPSYAQRVTAIENADTAIETPAYTWQPQEAPPVAAVPKKRRNFLQRLLAALFGR